MTVASRRVCLYGLDVSFRQISAVDIADEFAGQQFDLIVYWASLEHMTRDERDVSLRAAWHLLAPGGRLAVHEAPNRLWYHDSHTSFLPFFYWLPDDLAVAYAQQSPRRILREFDDVAEVTPDHLLSLTRHGRGVSFHDLEVALGATASQRVVSAMDLFNRKRHLVWNVIWRFSADRGYEQFLRKRFPAINPAYFQPYLNIILAKD